MKTTFAQTRSILPARTALSLWLCAAVTCAFAQRSPEEVETITGGTFLNFNTTSAGETRGSYSISPITLGADAEYPAGSGTFVNWSVNDSSDSSFMVNGRCIEDNNRRTSAPPYVGANYNPFSVTLSGLTPGGAYGFQVVGLGRHSDPVSDPSGLLDGLRPDIGIHSYDFSYGASAGSLTTFADNSSGTLLWEARASSAINVGGVDYYYYTGSYACDIGDWTADGSGSVTLYLGQGVLNTYENGSRTMLDGIVVTPVPEPSTLAFLGLGALALILRRRK